VASGSFFATPTPLAEKWPSRPCYRTPCTKSGSSSPPPCTLACGAPFELKYRYSAQSAAAACIHIKSVRKPSHKHNSSVQSQPQPNTTLERDQLSTMVSMHNLEEASPQPRAPHKSQHMGGSPGKHGRHSRQALNAETYPSKTPAGTPTSLAGGFTNCTIHTIHCCCNVNPHTRDNNCNHMRGCYLHAPQVYQPMLTIEGTWLLPRTLLLLPEVLLPQPPTLTHAAVALLSSQYQACSAGRHSVHCCCLLIHRPSHSRPSLLG